MNLQLEHFDLGKLAEEVLRESQMINGGHEYDSRIESVWIYADKGLIKQALRILMDNAIKYTNTGGRITLSVSQEGASAQLTVQDEGIGIPPEAVSQIFERFYRTDQSRARATGGSGLGLSIAKWIVERHGGHIEVLSRQGIGTRMTISIPSPDPSNHLAPK
jgi:signal transduction histidine kinase